ncbi:MAG: metallophosphoesterase [Phycisphaerae bacterium]
MTCVSFRLLSHGRTAWHGLSARGSRAESPCHAIGALFILLLAFAGGPARAVRADTVSFQEGVNAYAATVDTFLQEDAPDSPQGTLKHSEWDGDDPPGTGRDNIALIRFDNIFGVGVDQIPAGAQITSATLTYRVINAGADGRMHDVLIDWDETVTYNGFGGDATPGAQPTEYAASFLRAPGGTGNQTVNVTNSVAAWSADPASNHGWIILPVGTDGVELRTREAGPTARRPLLSVTFNEGPPVVSLVRRPYLQKGAPTSMTVVWRTDLTTDTRLRYGLTDGILDQTVFDPALGQDHVVTINGLTPDTTYFYDVGATTEVLAGGDADHFFKTPPNPGASLPYSVWIVGDSGTGGANQAAVRDAMLTFTAGTPPDLFVHVGDMAYDSGTDTEFTNNFFAPHQDILRNTVCWPAIGNHEAASAQSGTQSGPYYEAYVLPIGGESGGVASGTEAYYAFDHGNVHYICLDSHDTDRSPGSTMLTWLQADLAATTQDWIVAFWHHPPYSKGTHDSDNVSDSGGRLRDMRENVLPIIEAGGVDLVLGGHSHIYERSFLVDGAYDTPTTAAGHIVDGGDGDPAGDGPYRKRPGINAREGAVYIVAGHGGRGLGGTGDHPLMFLSELAFGSCILSVDDQTLTLRNIRADGVVSDLFELTKAPLAGDIDDDLDVDGDDTTLFIAVLLGTDTDPNHVTASDLDNSGQPDGDDVGLFVSALIGFGA